MATFTIFGKTIFVIICLMLASAIHGCHVDWECKECLSNGCRYFSNKFGFHCVSKITPVMRVRFVYAKADCSRKSFISYFSHDLSFF